MFSLKLVYRYSLLPELSEMMLRMLTVCGACLCTDLVSPTAARFRDSKYLPNHAAESVAAKI